MQKKKKKGLNNTNPNSPKNWESERPSEWSNRTPALSIVSEPVEPKIQSNKNLKKKLNN